MEKKEEIIEVTNETEMEVTSVMISSLIHIIRGKQVILDSDLAMLSSASFSTILPATTSAQKQSMLRWNIG